LGWDEESCQLPLAKWKSLEVPSFLNASGLQLEDDVHGRGFCWM
jgi:hypothetical protein